MWGHVSKRAASVVLLMTLLLGFPPLQVPSNTYKNGLQVERERDDVYLVSEIELKLQVVRSRSEREREGER